jgi:hypothetical protein
LLRNYDKNNHKIKGLFGKTAMHRINIFLLRTSLKKLNVTFLTYTNKYKIICSAI